jgi:hypothetical protein
MSDALLVLMPNSCIVKLKPKKRLFIAKLLAQFIVLSGFLYY